MFGGAGDGGGGAGVLGCSILVMDVTRFAVKRLYCGCMHFE